MAVADSRRHPSTGRGAAPEVPPSPRPPSGDGDEPLLPPGHRDPSGFWIPDGYEAPASLFTPQQRHLQERQRQSHRARRRDGAGDGNGGADAAARTPGNGAEAPDGARRGAPPRVDSPRGSD